MTDILSIESICNSVMTISGVDKRNMALLAFLLHMILIAESKTMAATQDEIAKGNFLAHCPLFDGIANAIMESLHGDNVDQLSIRTAITVRLAASLQRMIYEFPNKALGIQAIRAFTGVVFRQLHPDDYDECQTRYLDQNVRIISSLYGWLRPSDIIKPYRFDFKSKVAPGGISLMKYWTKDVTIALIKDLQERGDREIIDLLPADASKCIDWKLVKRFAKVYKVDFKMQTGADERRTPNSGRLKELRGRLLDLIIRRRLTTAAGIATLESPNFMPDPDGSRLPDTLSFLTA